MRYIDEIWIIDPDGITLFNYSQKKSEDGALIGGFFSGIYKFLKEIRNEAINSINLGNSKFVFYQSPEGFLFIAQAKIMSIDEEIIRRLKLVESEFFEKYQDILHTWDGNINRFFHFSKNINKVFSSI